MSDDNALRARARFITVEGQDGAGKTTNLATIEQLVRTAGHCVLRTREPGGTPLGDEIRRLVMHRRDLAIDPMAELLMIFAARAQHLKSVIEPALAAGTWVVCDRFTDATYAYQGGGRGLDEATIGEFEQRALGGMKPDLTVLFDVDTATGEQRSDESGDPDRFEGEHERFKDRVRGTYLDRARAEPDRIRVVDATRPIETVTREVTAIMRDYLDGAQP